MRQSKVRRLPVIVMNLLDVTDERFTIHYHLLQGYDRVLLYFYCTCISYLGYHGNYALAKDQDINIYSAAFIQARVYLTMGIFRCHMAYYLD